MVWLGCDKYNVVEPRFYSEDDVVTFTDCDIDQYAVSGSQVVPDRFAVGGCWYDRAEGMLAVFVALPTAGLIRVSILNSGGGVEAVLFDKPHEAGYPVFPWVAKGEGIYAISLETEYTSLILWFEVD